MGPQRALSNPSSPTSLSRAQSFDFRDEVKALEINYAIPSPSPDNVDVDHEMPPHSAPSPSKIRKKEKRILRKNVAFNELALQEDGDENAAKRLSFEIIPGSDDKEDNEKDDHNQNENEDTNEIDDGVPALDAMK